MKLDVRKIVRKIRASDWECVYCKKFNSGKMKRCHYCKRVRVVQRYRVRQQGVMIGLILICWLDFIGGRMWWL